MISTKSIDLPRKIRYDFFFVSSVRFIFLVYFSYHSLNLKTKKAKIKCSAIKLIVNYTYQQTFSPNKNDRNASSLFVSNLCPIKYTDKHQLFRSRFCVFTHRQKFFASFWYTSKSHFVYCQKCFLKSVMKIDTTIHNTKVTKYL